MNINSVANSIDISSRLLESGSLLDQVDALKQSTEQIQTPESLQQVARDFESVFMSLILKELRESLDTSEDGTGGLFPSDKSGSLGGIFDMFLSKHLAENSPLGVADMIQQYLAHRSPAADGEASVLSAVTVDDQSAMPDRGTPRIDVRR